MSARVAAAATVIDGRTVEKGEQKNSLFFGDERANELTVTASHLISIGVHGHCNRSAVLDEYFCPFRDIDDTRSNYFFVSNGGPQ